MENNNKVNLQTKYRAVISFDDYSNVSDIMVSYYLPIIGSEAFSLYSALTVDARNEMINNQYISIEERLLPMISLSIEKIGESILRLELLKLLEVYKDEEEKVIFKLLRPLSPEQFNNSKQFSEILRSAAGVDNLEISNKLFNSMKDTNIISDNSITNKIDITDSIDIQSSKLNIEVNLESIKNILNARKIDWSQFWTKELDDKLTNFISLYEVSSLDVAIEVINEFESGSFNIDNIERRLSENFSVIRDINSLITSGENTTEAKLDLMNQLNIRDYFVHLLNRVPTTTEEEMINKLKTKNKFDDQMIKVIVDFSILVNDGAIVPNYITKIANTVVKEKIDNADDLMKYLKVAYSVKKQKSNISDEEVGKLNKPLEDVQFF